MIPSPHQPYEPDNDPLDGLLRDALQRNTPFVQPPKQIWERIQSQVTAGPAPRSHRPPTERLSRLLAPFVQGMAAAVVLILVGMSLVSNRGGTIQPLESTGPLPTPAVAGASALLVRPASIQRQGGSAIVDDALDYSSGRNLVRQRTPPVEHSLRLRMVEDPDIDRILDPNYVLVVNRP